jgi:hypothetical protein
VDAEEDCHADPHTTNKVSHAQQATEGGKFYLYGDDGKSYRFGIMYDLVFLSYHYAK